MNPRIRSWQSYFRSRKPTWFAGAVVAFSCAWIFLTDKLVGHLSHTMATAMRWDTVSDCFYVAISGGVIYALLRQLEAINDNLEQIVGSRTAALAASEEELRTREEWLLRLLASLPDVSWTTSEHMRTMFVSPNVEEIFGYSVAEVYENTERVFLGSIHPEDRQRVIEGFQGLFTRRQRFDEEFRAQRKDGGWIWVHDRSVRTHTENGVLFADGIMSDITARKEAEFARIASDQRYRLLFERNLAAVFRAEVGGKLIDCNPALVRMLGYDSSLELLGRASAEILYDPAEQSDLLESLAGCGAISNVEIRLRRKDGSPVWGLHNVSLMASENGRPPCIEGTVIDVTERRQAADTLQKQLALMQTITSTAPNGLFLLDAEGRLTFMNPAAERMLGYTTTELLGKVMHDVCHDRRRDGSLLPKSECTIAQACGSGKSFNGYEDVHYRKDGTGIEMSFSGAPLFEGETLMGAVLVAQDITGRKLAEQQYQALHEQFLQAQKMEAVGRLAGGIAHDFNNLLQVINGYSSLIVEECASDPQLAKRASAIHEAGSRAAHLTQQLLDFSRKSASDAHVISLDKAVLEMTKMLRTMVGEDVEFSTHMRSNGASVKINAGQLEQLIMNLAVNARDAMPNGGKLHLETRCLNLNESQRKDFGFIPSGVYVRLSVSDTGCGMDADTISHAFEPFFTTKERGKGTGLGLSTVYGIVTQNGGGIQIESAPGAGTAFHICLPATGPGTTLAEVSPHPSPLKGTECILLAEDEDNVRSLIACELTRLGYRVVEAGNGVDALQLACDAPQSFDMLITDMIMPKLGGHELSARIRELSPAIRIVQMSGYDEAPQPPSGDGPPGIEHLQKPFDLASLAAIVRRVLDQ
jgi:two-component system cell cycle sensor histidine kinase/response regulator CckA